MSAHPLNRRLNTQDALIWSTFCSNCNHSRRKIGSTAVNFAVGTEKLLFTSKEMLTRLFIDGL